MKNSRNLLVCLLVLFHQALFAATKTLLVTGGAGFIGSNFVTYMYNMHDKYNIIVLDNLTYSGNLDNIPDYVKDSPRYTFVKGDICDPQVVDNLMSKANFVVHFAAETDVTRSISDDEIFFVSNVLGTRNLLHHLVKHMDKVERFVHISSSEVYGTCEGEVIDENHPLKPMSPYAAAKAGADRAVYAYGCTYDAPVTTLRFFNNYGPAQHLEKVVAKYIGLSLSNQPLLVHGDGEQMRDWIHVTDTARAVDAALQVPDFSSIKNEVINCGTGVATSIIEIARKVLLNSSSTCPYIKFTDDRPGQVHKHISSTEKAEQLLGWKAQIHLEEGLIYTMDWYKQNKESWEMELKNPQLYRENSNLTDDKKGLEL